MQTIVIENKIIRIEFSDEADKYLKNSSKLTMQRISDMFRSQLMFVADETEDDDILSIFDGEYALCFLFKDNIVSLLSIDDTSTADHVEL